MKQIEDLNGAIHDLKKEDAEYNSKMSKIEEEITSHKAHKKFLDLIAIAANIKSPVNQAERRRLKELRNVVEGEDFNFDEDERPSFDNRARMNDATFIT